MTKAEVEAVSVTAKNVVVACVPVALRNVKSWRVEEALASNPPVKVDVPETRILPPNSLNPAATHSARLFTAPLGALLIFNEDALVIAAGPPDIIGASIKAPAKSGCVPKPAGENAGAR